MSPPSSRQPGDPSGGGAELPKRGRRHEPTMFEVAQQSPSPPHRREEKRTIFGMAREVLGLAEAAHAPGPEQSAGESARRIAVAQVRTVGAAHAAPVQTPRAGLDVTAPQFRVPHQAVRPSEPEPQPRGPYATTHELPQNAVQVARPVQTPMPAQASYGPRSQPEQGAEPRYAAGTPYPPPEARRAHAYQPGLPAQANSPAPSGPERTYGAAQAAAPAPYALPEPEVRRHAEARKDRNVEINPAGFDPLARQAYATPQPAYAAQTTEPSRAQQTPTASLSGPDAATAFVDMRQFMAKGVELPALGRSEQPAATWSPQSSAATEPEKPVPVRLGRAHWSRRAVAQDEQVDLNFVLGRMSGRTLLLFGACVVAILLAATSVFVRSEPAPPAIAATNSAQRARAPAPRRAAPPVAEAELLATELPQPAPPKQPRTAQIAATQQDQTQGLRQPPAEEPEAAVGEPQASPGHERAEHVSASPERAATLYIGGKYKEALAEYRLLATAYPKQRVYNELARILKRKIIDTCLRTQPNRREQCKEL